MHLEVKGERLISEVQKDFTLSYPFLKIEFFKNGGARKERYAFDKLIPHQLPLKEAWFLNMQEGDLEFGDETTVLELEKEFMGRFALSVQVFRKSGNLWLETTFTDNWTLKRQNDHGREISTENHRREQPGDYDLSRLE
jgi:hypothetical protein